MKSANRDIRDSLFYWGVPKVYCYGIAVRATSWQGVSSKRRKRIDRAVRKLAKQVEGRQGKIRVPLKTRGYFAVMRKLVSGCWNPADRCTGGKGAGTKTNVPGKPIDTAYKEEEEPHWRFLLFLILHTGGYPACHCVVVAVPDVMGGGRLYRCGRVFHGYAFVGSVKQRQVVAVVPKADEALRPGVFPQKRRLPALACTRRHYLQPEFLPAVDVPLKVDRIPPVGGKSVRQAPQLFKAPDGGKVKRTAGKQILHPCCRAKAWIVFPGGKVSLYAGGLMGRRQKGNRFHSALHGVNKGLHSGVLKPGACFVHHLGREDGGGQ